MRLSKQMVSSLPIAAGMLLATSAHAQETVTVAAPPVMAPPAVEATPAVTPPPAVSTLPTANDRIAPQAQADVAPAEPVVAVERQTARATVAPRPAPRIAVLDVTPAPVTDAIAPDAPAVNVPSDAQIDPVADPAPEPVEAAPVASETDDGNNEWLLGGGILAALGLAGLALASRRRRRTGDVVTKTAPTHAAPAERVPVMPERKIAAEPAFIAPTPDPFFAQQRQVTAQRSSDPIFAARADDVRPTTDPLFAFKPEQMPITDPLFSRKVDVPPVTDPMFANRPEYQGRTTVAGEPGQSAYAHTDRRVDELEPAE
jgi:MYXO-CTERM domain-containing protein